MEMVAIQLTYGLIGDEVVSAMERTASQDDFRANLLKGGNGRSINLRVCLGIEKNW